MNISDPQETAGYSEPPKEPAEPKKGVSKKARLLIPVAIICAAAVAFFVLYKTDMIHFPDDHGKTVISSANENTENENTEQTGDVSISADDNAEGSIDSGNIKEIDVVSLTLNEDQISFSSSGETYQLIATVLNSTGATPVYSSQNPQVAVVGETGLIQAVAAGETDILVTVDGASAQCHVICNISSDYILPSDQRYITKEELDALTREEVELARNEIYARHGYVFKTEKYAQYFSSKAWYHPNPEYDSLDDTQFTEIEKKNRDLIVDYETEKGWRK